ncbi:MAG TPA: helix-turn-helix domain-containing protein [Trebonia sp.]|jgi:AcrR family transcriptional regulator|nr:helix-turn-helix domain-containing protein [Trebonia sp.]
MTEVAREEPGPRAPGLRERSKARRKDAIIRAAYRLFAERGYDATTVADIAAEAEVAPRTVAMYFPSKQDIALSRFTEAADDLTAALRDRAAGETAARIVRRWLRAGERPADYELRQLSKQMFAANPGLNALRNARMSAVIAEGAAALAAELGCLAGDPGPRIAATAAAAVLIELTDIPLGPGRDEAMTVAFRFLEAGITALRPAG